MYIFMALSSEIWSCTVMPSRTLLLQSFTWITSVAYVQLMLGLSVMLHERPLVAYFSSKYDLTQQVERKTWSRRRYGTGQYSAKLWLRKLFCGLRVPSGWRWRGTRDAYNTCTKQAKRVLLGRSYSVPLLMEMNIGVLILKISWIQSLW